MQRRVALVFGTRPEAIKMAPLIREFGAHGDFEPLVVSTGQHSDLLDQVLHEFGVRPDVELRVKRTRQTLAELTAGVISGVDTMLEEHRPHAVLVHGDTTTTLGASLASYYRTVPLVHVEAGLRSGNRWAPFPEEVNRRITSLVTDLHLAPTPQARQNLLAEGVNEQSVVVTGNTVIDAMRAMLDSSPADHGDPGPAALAGDPRRMLLFTLHRREAWGSSMTRIAQGVVEAADAHPDMVVVACVHPNPAVRAALLPALRGRHNVIVTDPQPYRSFLRLIRRAHAVVTDSGGVQEESTGLGRPVLVLREVTERQEGVRAGGVRLIGTDKEAVRAAITELWSDPGRHARMSEAISPYGDGRAAGRCVAAVARMLGLTDAAVQPYEPDLRIGEAVQ
ncbi:non-hydrolyzing UDP-N-acetylglucosamine 2-epimerase [Streptomyces sp. NBC_01190]|uniref:non-hydrolyzing UDP-N-acetylglucosamine 2-epimerase n=1 Tax=Streptomyces sp. NBC_01190 TaxID=2903767 RepID=UPI00386596E6|nr:UDP-N-acetylglucosamine 2-epimerase (non-hydrolyzing) [Streptomyces sp. NBC_01190]